MLNIKEIYEDAVLDNINAAENGDIGHEMFNRLSRRAELRMMDYLSGDVENVKPPFPYVSQKDKDWIAPFIEKHRVQVSGGIITRPDNYYLFENMYLLGDYAITNDEGEDEIVNEGNTPIDLLESDEFNERKRTYIEDLKPSLIKPIAKAVGRTFEFDPMDMGSVVLEYYRYPVFGKIVTKVDPIYHNEVIDETLSTNYEYDEWARELLVFFITDTYSIHTREVAIKQTNQATGKLIRG